MRRAGGSSDARVITDVGPGHSQERSPRARRAVPASRCAGRDTSAGHRCEEEWWAGESAVEAFQVRRHHEGAAITTRPCRRSSKRDAAHVLGPPVRPLTPQRPHAQIAIRVWRAHVGKPSGAHMLSIRGAIQAVDRVGRLAYPNGIAVRSEARPCERFHARHPGEWRGCTASRGTCAWHYSRPTSQTNALLRSPLRRVRRATSR